MFKRGNGHTNFEDLPDAVRIPHAPGDLLVLSAHLIQRGTYGLERKSFDILYTDFPERKDVTAHYKHFPDAVDFPCFEHPEIYSNV